MGSNLSPNSWEKIYDSFQSDFFYNGFFQDQFLPSGTQQDFMIGKRIPNSEEMVTLTFSLLTSNIQDLFNTFLLPPRISPDKLVPVCKFLLRETGFRLTLRAPKTYIPLCEVAQEYQKAYGFPENLYYLEDEETATFIEGGIINNGDQTLITKNNQPIGNYLAFLCRMGVIDTQAVSLLRSKTANLDLAGPELKKFLCSKIYETFHRDDHIIPNYFSEIFNYADNWPKEYPQCTGALIAKRIAFYMYDLGQQGENKTISDLRFLEKFPNDLRKTKLFVSLISDVLLDKKLRNREKFNQTVDKILNNKELHEFDKASQLIIYIFSFLNHSKCCQLKNINGFTVLTFLYAQPIYDILENDNKWDEILFSDWDELRKKENAIPKQELEKIYQLPFYGKNSQLFSFVLPSFKMKYFKCFSQNWNYLHQSGIL